MRDQASMMAETMSAIHADDSFIGLVVDETANVRGRNGWSSASRRKPSAMPKRAKYSRLMRLSRALFVAIQCETESTFN